jgi:2-iminobutanoate/2-iminopropanoate deaminase
MNNISEKPSARSKDVYPIGKKNPNLPFHPAVRAGDYIFVSGQVAKDAEGNMISGTIEVETKGTIEAIARILAEEGATLADVVRVTTYLDDVRDFGRYNKVFGEYFKDAVLARTTVEARAVINTKVEMDAIVYKPKRP